jgi:ATP-dependent HslUV protease ATP-binding subunit HslU
LDDIPAPPPKETVSLLDRHIVGQTNAKKAIAIALRNRWRVQQIPPEFQKEILPKNILMIGPTGVGKTELARRAARLAGVPFLKVEATKFTELGFVGRDVESIIQDLMDLGIREVKDALCKDPNIQKKAEIELVNVLSGHPGLPENKEEILSMLNAGLLDHIVVEPPYKPQELSISSFIKDMKDMKDNIRDLSKGLDMMSVAMPSKPERMKVKEARTAFPRFEVEKIPKDRLAAIAKARVQNFSIVFIDEIDKICSPPNRYKSSGVNTDGVQRDLLPIIEGTIVSTKQGDVDTSRILFICAGAFHICKPSDMLAELKGRLPIKVELDSLTEDDFYRILTQPQYNLIAQQTALMEQEGVRLVFPDETIREIAKISFQINQTVQNIGARRLFTVMEKMLE